MEGPTEGLRGNPIPTFLTLQDLLKRRHPFWMQGSPPQGYSLGQVVYTRGHAPHQLPTSKSSLISLPILPSQHTGSLLQDNAGQQGNKLPGL